MYERPGREEPAAGWPELPFDVWKDTQATLHLWTQIVGKIRLACTPWINHQWHVTQYVTARGLTTSMIPYARSAFQIDFDFVDHRLEIACVDGRAAELRLYPRSVADFHDELMARLRQLDLEVRIHRAPNELPDPIPFAEDDLHASYDAVYANRFWRALVSSARVLGDFRGRFLGKSSPVHFFWGGFDLAVTRFSGRRAPPHPGGIAHLPDRLTREAYSHEVSSAGFWAGGASYPHPMFYSYAYPTPEGLADQEVRPAAAAWNPDLGEFVLPYSEVRAAADPDAALMDFLESTYAAAADLAAWDRPSLEWLPGARPALPSRKG